MFLDVKAASGAGAAAQDDAALLGFAAEAAVAVSEHILQSLLRDFPTNEQCWHFCAVRPVRRVLAAARAAQEGSAAVSAASAGSSVMLEIEQRPAKRARQAARAGAEALKPAEAHSMGVFEDAVKVRPLGRRAFAQHSLCRAHMAACAHMLAGGGHAAHVGAVRAALGGAAAV